MGAREGIPKGGRDVEFSAVASYPQGENANKGRVHPVFIQTADASFPKILVAFANRPFLRRPIFSVLLCGMDRRSHRVQKYGAARGPTWYGPRDRRIDFITALLGHTTVSNILWVVGQQV